MKKLLTLFAALSVSALLSAQVLDKQQMKNTAWTGLGAPMDGDISYYGFTDTFQARFDISNFTIEGMLNWSFLANYDDEGNVDNFVFGTSNANPLSLHYGCRGADASTSENTLSAAAKAAKDAKFNNAVNVSNTIQDSYYVNFLWHLSKNLDVGVGTKLNWQVGPAPRYGSWLWESDAHVRQGGFSTAYDDRSGSSAQTSTEGVGTYKFKVDAPGTADVVGFVPYANKYAKRALGVRFIDYSNKDMKVQLGAAIPNGFNTDDPAINFGAQLGIDWISLALAMEGAFDEAANFYTGAELFLDKFTIDLYFGADSLFTDAEDDVAYGTGAAVAFVIPNTKFAVKPELGVNFFENDNYSFAWYAGGTFAFGLTNQIGINIWSSFAVGSSDKRWDDDDYVNHSITKDWNGGHIFDIRPSITLDYSKNTTFSAYLNYENRKAFDGKTRNCWSTGLFMTYVF